MADGNPDNLPAKSVANRPTGVVERDDKGRILGSDAARALVAKRHGKTQQLKQKLQNTLLGAVTKQDLLRIVQQHLIDCTSDDARTRDAARKSLYDVLDLKGPVRIEAEVNVEGNVTQQSHVAAFLAAMAVAQPAVVEGEIEEDDEHSAGG